MEIVRATQFCSMAKMPFPKEIFKDAPVTDKQKAFLRKMGIGYSGLKSKKQASALIDMAIRRMNAGMATPGQMRNIAREGVQDVSKFTFKEAKMFLGTYEEETEEPEIKEEVKSMERMNIVVATDGACSGNPGPGGYAAILRFGEHEKEISGFMPKTTNNRMELTALIEAVKVLKKPCSITFKTDSQYVCSGIANAKDWEARGWRTKSGGRCANDDLWKELTELGKAGKHHFAFQYVKGHAGDPDNERCDEMAKAQILRNKED